ncbi:MULTISPECIES: COX15/CtaA family protein [Pseudoalteromonas]|uniref:Cytochrome B n=1 Tax=Pseudoalteromonas amylolytica TaxID=1859457 RepID=A0A1S1MUR2_9GAMM|nr:MULTISPECIES: COX15/CtaA family protein [Pseudoalteromonas]OHU86343.1 cytochrome B [Pseudoalteromonas sp. JW3]OHU89552.1 cytochrome B [Pseudoalteromonas amylolytica]
MSKGYKLLILAACTLALLVVSLGAYTRLSNAGLGCPDWPGCYGFLTVPNESHELTIVEKNFPNAQVEPKKAWIEMVHRYFASLLGLMIVALCIVAFRQRTNKNHKQVVVPFKHALLLMAMVLFQGLLGMWTVTMNLQPFVVMGHLLGGFTILALLVLMYLRVHQPADVTAPSITGHFLLAIIGLVVLVIQIALGGWVAANYAAPHCSGLPVCSNIELFSLESLFHLPIGQSNYEFGVLPFETRLSIHFIHRIWAMVTALTLIWVGWKIYRAELSSKIRSAVILVSCVLFAQLFLGGLIVHLQFPLLLTLFHNVMAALLLLSMVRLCFLLAAKQGATI